MMTTLLVIVVTAFLYLLSAKYIGLRLAMYWWDVWNNNWKTTSGPLPPAMWMWFPYTSWTQRNQNIRMEALISKYFNQYIDGLNHDREHESYKTRYLGWAALLWLPRICENVITWTWIIVYETALWVPRHVLPLVRAWITEELPRDG